MAALDYQGGLVRRTVLPVAAVLLTAACSTATPTLPAVGRKPPITAASASTTYLPDSVTTSLGAIGDDTKKIAHHGDDDRVLASDCRQLGTDASSASVETIPNPTWQAQWVKAMSELQKAADECSSGASTGDNATMQQALTDLAAANDDLLTFSKMSAGS